MCVHVCVCVCVRVWYPFKGMSLSYAVCTVVTTVIGDQIVAVVSDQDTDYKWLVDGQSTPNLSVKTQELGHVHITCGTADSGRGPVIAIIHIVVQLT